METGLEVTHGMQTQPRVHSVPLVKNKYQTKQQSMTLAYLH